MTDLIATVLGGTGFLGKRVVAALARHGYAVRVASRRPSIDQFAAPQDRLRPLIVDICDEQAVRAAVTGSEIVVNAVSLYEEAGDLTFEAIHVVGAARVARQCREEGVSVLVQLSGIGVDGHSPSRYISARARGEAAVRDELATAILLRPAVMFGPDDTFLHGIEQATRLPVIPLFGRGDTRLQPAYVHDVAMAIVRIAQRQYHGEVFELGGAETLTYRQLVEAVCEQAGRRRWLLPFPFALWKPLVHIMSLLPDPPMTIDQLYLLSTDNVATGNVKTFQDLSLQPGAVTDLIGDCLGL